MEIVKNDYFGFLQLIKEIITTTEAKIIADVNRQKVEMCWNIGKNIDEHLAQNDRGEYGKKLFTDLAKDVGIAEKTLYQMRSFYKTYPTLSANENLNWTHYRSLISVKDDQQRQYLENLIIEEKLSSRALTAEISKNRDQPDYIPNQALPVRRGKTFIYKVAQINGEKYLDLGFNIFQKFNGPFEEGDLLESVKDGKEFSFKKSEIRKFRTYTYKAHLEKVVDGDTIRTVLDLGFNVFHREILRLAKINAPERGTEEGKRSSKRLQDILKSANSLVIKTNKIDIYGRYVADVFLNDEEGEYLNQKLLDLGLARFEKY